MYSRRRESYLKQIIVLGLVYKHFKLEFHHYVRA